MATPAYLARKQLKKIITTVNMGLMDGGTGMRPQHLKLWCCLIFQNHANLFQLTHLLKMEKNVLHAFAKRTDKTERFPVRILDDYKTGVITQIQAVGRIGNVFSALESGDSKR